MEEHNKPESHAATGSPLQPAAEKAAALQRIIAELLPFRIEDRRMLIETLTTFFGLSLQNNEISGVIPASAHSSSRHDTGFQFSETSEARSPKHFVLEKSPKTDVERVACLAYYLAHHRGTPHFKTKDISALNTESAHKRFSNAAVAVENAAKMGYLVPSVKGSKQLSAIGERFVEALPDREAAREIFERPRQRRGGSTVKKNTRE